MILLREIRIKSIRMDLYSEGANKSLQKDFRKKFLENWWTFYTESSALSPYFAGDFTTKMYRACDVDCTMLHSKVEARVGTLLDLFPFWDEL